MPQSKPRKYKPVNVYKSNPLREPKIKGRLRISLWGRTYEIKSGPTHADGYRPIHIIHVGDDRSGEGGYFDATKFFDVVDKFYQEHF